MSVLFLSSLSTHSKAHEPRELRQKTRHSKYSLKVNVRASSVRQILHSHRNWNVNISEVKITAKWRHFKTSHCSLSFCWDKLKTKQISLPFSGKLLSNILSDTSQSKRTDSVSVIAVLECMDSENLMNFSPFSPSQNTGLLTTEKYFKMIKFLIITFLHQ